MGADPPTAGHDPRATGAHGRPGASLRDGLRRHLRAEDVILFVWLVVIQPSLAGSSGTLGAASGPDLILGLVDLAALLAFVACLAARSEPGVVSGLVGQGDLLYAVGPLFGAFAFTFDATRENLGLTGNLDLLPLVLGIVVAILVRRFLAPLSAIQRRALVTPFVLVTSRFFGDFLRGLTDLFDLRRLAVAIANPADLAGTAFVLLIASTGLLIFYVMFVFAPRQIADRQGTPRSWVVRFLVFLLSVVLSQTIGGALHPA